MWICKNCGEESEENFDVCWNCQHTRDGTPATSSLVTEGELQTHDSGEARRPKDRAAPSARASGIEPLEYLVVPFVGQLKQGFFSSQNARDVSRQLQAVINEHHSQGWEFHSISKVEIEVPPGCLWGLLGAGPSQVVFDQLVFRRSH